MFVYGVTTTINYTMQCSDVRCKYHLNRLSFIDVIIKDYKSCLSSIMLKGPIEIIRAFTSRNIIELVISWFLYSLKQLKLLLNFK